MSKIQVREMTPEDRYFIGTCSHVNESAEADASSSRRLAYIDALHQKGMRALAAVDDGQTVAFAYVVPIEVSPWGPLGQDLAVIPCLYVPDDHAGQGIGRLLVEAAERIARDQGRKGIAVEAYYHDFWLMPAPFFERCGFEIAREYVHGQPDSDAPLNRVALMWKRFDPTAEAPEFLTRHYVYEPLENRVRVDLFYNTFCHTSDVEAQRVREVAAEFGGQVALYEYCNDDPAVLQKYQISRAIFVNGQEIGWGYEAPRENLREAFQKAVAES